MARGFPPHVPTLNSDQVLASCSVMPLVSSLYHCHSWERGLEEILLDTQSDGGSGPGCHLESLWEGHEVPLRFKQRLGEQRCESKGGATGRSAGEAAGEGKARAESVWGVHLLSQEPEGSTHDPSVHSNVTRKV